MTQAERRESLRIQLGNAKMDLLYQIKKVGKQSNDCAFRALSEVETTIWECSERDDNGFFTDKPKVVFHDYNWTESFVNRVRIGLNGKFIMSKADKKCASDLLNNYDAITDFIKADVQAIGPHRRLLISTYALMRDYIYERTGERNICF